MTTQELTPKAVFHYFNEVCQVPRPSKKEVKMIAFLQQFGKAHNLETLTDPAGNVLIRKPATKGLEHLQTVVLQSHIDMVCEKNGDVEHDFLKDPIQTVVDGDWLKAKGTTLGADNGIGVATELAVLAADDIQHGPLECLFTVDEETGLTGAFALKSGFMTGDILLNLDSEDEGEIFIGCAGGCRTEAIYKYKPDDANREFYYFRVTVKGLTGGHSGDDIIKGRANANKLLVRFLMQLLNKHSDFHLAEIQGGNLHNAIPREASALCGVPMPDKESVRIDLNVFQAEVEQEFAKTDPSLTFELESEPMPESVIDAKTTFGLLHSLNAVFNGVYAMSQDIPGLVETSTNLASVKMPGKHEIRVVTSQRSSTMSSRHDVSEVVRSAFLLGGAVVETGEGYPGWKPNPESSILKVATESYERLFGTEPKVKAIHAGLECGLFMEKYPHMDMISFGPTLRGVHSPDERMFIPSVDRFWRHLLDILQHIPAKR
jgi:dipeptidase D